MASWSYAQGQKAEPAADAVAKVPALDAFHEVIYKIWHDAWPNKDASMLQKLLPDVEKGIAEVAGAKLPGILREKKAAWDENVKKLQAISSDYKAAATSKDDPKLLAAAEKLHSQYEAMVRVIRPALKELDDFHAVLYMIYHYYMPEKKSDKIKSSSAELKVKMAALNAAMLPERLKKIEETYTAARAKLSKSVDELEAALPSNNEAKIKQAIELVHTNYEMLNQLFE
jgi:NADH dehydrogenase/NADH:ubiquinone oxidoreductase subunit G